MTRNLLSIVLFLLIGVSGAFAQPKTVTDYYLAFPAGSYSSTIEGTAITGKVALAKHRRSLIKVEDIKNGYLKLEGPWEGWAEIALFKRNDGSYLIAESNVGCGPACSGSIKFMTYKAGKWTDVTRQFEPKFSESALFDAFKANGGVNSDVNSGNDLDFYFLLPREGRTLRVACNECEDSADDFVLFEYEWNGTKFVKK